MSKLVVGDRVLVDATGDKPVYEPVLDFLHSVASDREMDFIRVDHAKGQLRVTAKHLVFITSPGGVRTEKYAEDLQPGDELLVTFTGGDGTIPSTVLASGRDSGTSGVYAPLTPSGTIVVDGVVASNYANVPSHGAPHALFFFARAYHKLILALPMPWSMAQSPTASSEPKDDMHPLAMLFHNKYFKVDELLVTS
eukprot:TRINITY_DN21617_c0_g1_i1.p1 TRINITY_DN21617_c0_g1~~TRINITY_DN21617_c0_g1_i1.p1  ORF type:complete len:195 (+),score=37.66 TRINITY_DN21617_c0_g1_i1:520-1104(+)